MRMSMTLMKLTGKFAEKFVKYGAYSPTPLSLKKLTAFGQVGSALESATFLCDELPVRLANIMQEIQLLPEQLIQTPSASLVNRWYEESFCDLVEFEGVHWDEKILDKFNQKLAQIRTRHTTTVETMAHGVMEMQERHKTDLITNNQVQYFLDRFYMMRISLRMLINQHLLMFGSELNKHRRFVGSIDPDCNVLEILEDAYEDAKYLCEHYYSTAPDIKVNTCGDFNIQISAAYEAAVTQSTTFLSRAPVFVTSMKATNGKIEFVYVPSHLYHILFELLKNAMRAVVEHSSRSDSIPPIEVLVAAGQESVTIKISDLGGGIPRSELEFVFNYTYTTARGTEKYQPPQPIGDEGNAPLAGYGYGLPLSRLYAKYFNGDLILASVEGYGTDAIVYLKRNSAEADELLPVFNRTSARQYGAAGIPVADWSNPQFTTGWRRT